MKMQAKIIIFFFLIVTIINSTTLVNADESENSVELSVELSETKSYLSEIEDKLKEGVPILTSLF